MVLDKKVGGLDSLIFEIFLNLQELLGVFFLVLLFLHHFLLDADPANHGGVIAPQNPVEISFWQVLNEGGNGVVVNDLPFGLKGLGIHIEFLDLLDDLPEFGLVLLLNFLHLWLDELEISLRLNLLDKQRNQDDTNRDHQADD